jgi:hypothetical protein
VYLSADPVVNDGIGYRVTEAEVMVDPLTFLEQYLTGVTSAGNEVAGSPSFDLSYPKIPGRDVEGIPNANDPVMREKLRRRLLKNPEGGQQLPEFLIRGV